MSKTESEQFRELREMAEQFEPVQRKEAFFEFIRFCAERLKRDEQVQAIWHDYQESIQ